MGIRDLPGNKSDNVDSFAYFHYIIRYVPQKDYQIQAYYLSTHMFKRGPL